ncbi:type IV secretion system protein [Bartonella machadoae]|uniref:type IV secretion system protein n=1 Tax=Bartonella machadoae TaxID=2893471 RepID=UPI001F4CA3D4|nr:type IV secretion system protein [Bartonella machadoae]UNE54091.1 conjugal transfer protein [Bartonella machadoae]
MRRVIILATIAAVFTTMNSAKAFTFSPPVDLSVLWSGSTNEPQKPSMPKHYAEIIDLIKQNIKLHEEHLETTKKSYESITGKRNLGLESTDYSSFFLKDPHLIYDKNSNVFISKPKLLNDILREEKISNSLSEARKYVEKRIQYATAIDKNISLQAFQNTGARLEHLLALLKQIDKTTDLKRIAELQAHMKGMLAIIQNENAKLQMVAHLHEAEREFIKQQKYKRNMKILNSENKKMPTIRFIR